MTLRDSVKRREAGLRCPVLGNMADIRTQVY